MNKKNIIIISLLVIILLLLIAIIVLVGKVGKKSDNECNCTTKTTTEKIDYVITSPLDETHGEGITKARDYTDRAN